MNPVDIILKKRRGRELSSEEIRAFVAGVVDGSWRDYQISALLMAICMAGMSERETVDLTMAMAHSGDTLDLGGVLGVKADKHSTGGVGDTTTLILTPLVACCGVRVAKMSGRGLGHTGGTLDKLESIPGLSVDMEPGRFIAQLNRVGCGVIGQTLNLTPADKTMYALRDVTGTVDSLPLIVSSILSKKIASGADVVVLDVKTGSGAIMPTLEESIDLARQMVKIGSRTGRRFTALVTDMDQPLGLYVGNALEVEEAILALSGKIAGPLVRVSLLLGAHMLLGAGAVETVDDGLRMLNDKLVGGEGLEKLGDMIEAQGGDRRVVRDVNLLPRAPQRIPIVSEADGFVARMNTGLIGNAAKALGAGRDHKDDPIDPSVGVVMSVRVGDAVKRGDLLYELHAGARSDVALARALMARAVSVEPKYAAPPPLIHRVITRKDVQTRV